MRPVAPPTWIVFAASSSRCARTKPISRSPSGPGHEQRAADAERLVVLRDLVALRVVGIEVVLAREDGLVGDLAAEREAELDRPLDRLAVRDGQRARVREADRARARVRLGEVLELAAAEHLRPRLQMDVDLEPDDGFPLSAHRARSFASCSARSMSPFTSTMPSAMLERAAHLDQPELPLARLERELHVAARTARAPSSTRTSPNARRHAGDEVGSGIDERLSSQALRNGVERRARARARARRGRACSRRAAGRRAASRREALR